MALYRVKDWNAHYETHRTRELKKMDWLPVPTKMDGDGYTELLDHPDGTAHLGAWLALLLIAAKCEIRGTLSRSGGIPHDPASMSRISRVDPALFRAVLPRLVSIGWIEDISFDVNETAKFRVDPALFRDNPAPRARVLSSTLLSSPPVQSSAESRDSLNSDELESAWERHHKHTRGEPMNLAISRIVAMGGEFDVEKFRDRHPRFCAHWDQADWRFCSLSLLGWIEAGMPDPPPKPKTKRELESEALDRAFADEIEKEKT